MTIFFEQKLTKEAKGSFVQFLRSYRILRSLPHGGDDVGTLAYVKIAAGRTYFNSKVEDF